MVGAFWSRALNLGRDANPLEADLRRITEAELIDAPSKDVLDNVIRASHEPDDRRQILRHLQECLAESSGARWRRVHGGLVLLAELLRRGAPAVTCEIAEGMHFDPVQRLTFLEKFEYREDRRVQGIVRQKATALRSEMLARLDGADAVATIDGSLVTSGPGSKGSPGGGSGSGGPVVNNTYAGFGSDDVGANAGQIGNIGATSSSASGYVGFGSDDVGAHLPQLNGQGDHKSGRSKFVNGLVSVGHRDDTDSESDGSAHRRKAGSGKAAQERRRGGGVIHAKDGRKALEDSTDSGSDDDRPKRGRGRPAPAAVVRSPPKAAAPEVDLLGGMDSSPKKGGSVPAPPEDLLGGVFAEAPRPAEQQAKAAVSDLLDF